MSKIPYFFEIYHWTSRIIFFSPSLQDQKIPKPKRLQEWYKKMLDKGIIERIVLDYKDIYKQALEDNLQSAAELPYFEGDFWPNVMEENIREQEQVLNFDSSFLITLNFIRYFLKSMKCP
jgi:hypothetical protein